ncbi:DNA polymerase III subunit gamma/tau [Pseudoalteromonas sp. MMG013]|uniref:DNA polymerase III subunit gamma/tau n=1 Tax=Pseudoalteromonas sp. MMG013 TaxID=2822687 RepID=UPI001B36920D|nr:DNA polymerase III subunit gamma/tau [Pseudoalteromonas sp. MMG013]MBQ4863765.1 DNA polymerase III subunit gamma/tau [Pseudoalteromonas sp. MMG013]
MSYQVLARKWRPQTFHQLVGQAHVKQALVNALNEQRLHHAYLFTGTRGVGKTTIARIFAKSLNCDQGITSNPCGQCSSCQDIEAGKFIDLIEIDAASRTKVEDTREILDNVQYSPTRGRYKVYLIDEVHMLSKHSFNALLKTLEEPPEHVKFLLATTDPQKLPVTILSRCLQFNLNALSQGEITAQLEHILPQENVTFDEQSLQILAKAADGSMRDGLSLTDQAIAQTNGDLNVVAVQQMLGLMDSRHALLLLSAVLCQDGELLLTEVANIAVKNGNFISVLDDLIALCHVIQLAQLVPQAVQFSQFEEADVLAIMQQTDAHQVQLFYQLLLNGKKDLKWAPEQKLGFEMVMLRLLAFEQSDISQSSTPSTEHVTTSKSKVGDLRALFNKPAKQQSQPPQPSVSDSQAASQVIQSQVDQHTKQQTAEQQPQHEVTAPAIAEHGVIEHTSVNQAAAFESATSNNVNTVDMHSPELSANAPDVVESFAATPALDKAFIGQNNDQPAEHSAEQNIANEYSELMSQAVELGFSESQNTQSTQQPADNSNTQSSTVPQVEGDSLQAKQANANSAIAKILQNRNISGAGQLLQPKGEEPKKPTAHSAPHTHEHKRAVTVEKPEKKIPFAQKHQAKTENLAPELLEQIAPVKKAEQPEPAAQVVEIPEDFTSPISDIRFAHQQDEWAHLIKRMGLGGRMRQFALHSIFNKENNSIKLDVDASQQHLDSAILRQKLIASLSEIYGYEVEVDIVFAPGVIDSPFLIQQKIDAQRYQQAVDVINQDENVVQFVQEFAAIIDENTIQAL